MNTRFLAAGTALLLLAGVAVSATPAQAAPATRTTNPVLAAGGWLSTQFVDSTHLPHPDGDHFDSKYGKDYFANYGANADVIFGLAAAKTAAPVARRALTYLGDNLDAYADLSKTQGGPYDGSVAKTALAAVVQGVDPTAFPTSGKTVDLIAQLKADECAAGSATCTPGAATGIYASISEAFVLLAEARGGRGAAPSAAAVDYFLSLQCAKGGFTEGTDACGAKGKPDVDSTSYAIMALTAVGGHEAELAKAVTWLQGEQRPGGYWVSQGIPNTNSTGLAAAALSGTGADVTTARSWLRDQQVGAGKPGAGALRYDELVTPTTTSATSPSVLATAQGLNGLVDDGGLATVTAAGSDDAQHLFAPAATLSAASARVGSSQSVSGVGFVAGEKVRVELHSAPVTVATAAVGADGVAAVRYTVPAIAPGRHTVVLTGLTSGLQVGRTITVLAAPTAGDGGQVGTTTTTTTTTTTNATNATNANAPIAATGLDGTRLVATTVLGGVLLLLGLALLLAGRRRRSA